MPDDPETDLEQIGHDLWQMIEDAPPAIITFDGVLGPDEPDCDDVPLQVGDRVRVRFEVGGTSRPYYRGTVRCVDPWHDSLADHVFVNLDHLARTEHGAWFPRHSVTFQSRPDHPSS